MKDAAQSKILHALYYFFAEVSSLPDSLSGIDERGLAILASSYTAYLFMREPEMAYAMFEAFIDNEPPPSADLVVQTVLAVAHGAIEL